MPENAQSKKVNTFFFQNKEGEGFVAAETFIWINAMTLILK